ncbi:MAG: hypothetical protein L0H15_01200 [Nitrosospira sp.]|nr:hypothetical protein [Nitrosospira sp.]MDN5880737.1 hypothetical protein [Nitrosospira sp.]
MAKVYTDSQDELTITNVIKHGLRHPVPKWAVLRLALARSLRIATPPDQVYDRRDSTVGGSEYALKELTGEGKEEAEDQTSLFLALLSAYYRRDLFADGDAFVCLLQRHVRRGLREFRSGWIESHDFHDYLLHELFGDLGGSTVVVSDLRERLLRALAEIGIATEIVDALDGPRMTRFMVRLRDINDHSPLLRGLDKLAFVLGLGEAGVFVSSTTEPKIAALDVPRIPAQWRFVPAASLMAWLSGAPTEWHLPVYLGQDVVGRPIGFDLAAAPHLLIGGTTGSGKSVCLHALILSLLSQMDASRLKLLLIDPKRVELAPYARLPHCVDGVLTDSADALDALNRLVDEMATRENELARVGARDIDEQKAASLNLSRIVVVVEELADLLLQSGAIEEPLVRLVQKARATGIHLVLATQRPDAQTFSGLLRSNVPSRIALTVQKGSESKIIIDETGAEKLLGKGDMLVRLLGQPTVRVHGVMLGSDDIARGVASALRRTG